MTPSKLAICNTALGNLGITRKIQSIETERTQDAQTMRDLYDMVIETVLKASPWPFATKTVDLALVIDDYSVRWRYAYQYPADCLQFRRIMNNTPSVPIFGGPKYNRFSQYEIPWAIASKNDDSSKIILTNEAVAQGEYTKVITNPALFSGDFILSAAMLLASHAASQLTGGDPNQLGDRSLQKYYMMISKTMANAYQEEPSERMDSTSLENSRY